MKIQKSRMWESERSRHGGRPYTTFKLRDPMFFGVKAAHIYRQEQHWNWVYWDIAGHDFRPSATGFTSPEWAARSMSLALAEEAGLIRERRNALQVNARELK